MESLLKIRDSVASYLTPSAQSRHSGPTGSKLAEMQRPITPSSGPHGSKGKAVSTGRVSKKYLSPPGTKRRFSTVKIKDGEDEYDDDYVDEDDGDDANEHETEGEEVGDPEEDSGSEFIEPGDSASQVAAREETPQPESTDELDSDLEEELSAEAKVHQFLDHQSELARRQEALDRVREGDWHPDEMALFQKLSMRGFEPLLPSHWKMDFRTVPRQLFSPKDEETSINAQYTSDFRATHALNSLITLGSRVRGRTDCFKPEEPIIRKELENYLKWAAKDGSYADIPHLPLLVIVAAGADQDLTAISAATTSKLNALAQQHRRDLSHPPPGRINENGEVEVFTRKPPALYGIIVIRSMVVFVTLDSGKANSKLKTLAHFDFGNTDMDVWNGFAVAILVCKVRDCLMVTLGLDKIEEGESDDEKGEEL